MTILFCGFAAFPGAPANPTEDLARALHGRRTAAGEGIAGEVLPVEWEGSWPRLRGLVEALRPRAVLLFGLSAKASRLRIELLARNVRELGRVDAAGGFPSGPAVCDGPERLRGRLPLAAVAAALRRAGTDFEWSEDAGRYLCNDTYYRLALAAGSLGVESFGFFHVPVTDELVEAWAAAGTLPERFRTVPAARLLDAAMAIAEALPSAGGPALRGQGEPA